MVTHSDCPEVANEIVVGAGNLATIQLALAFPVVQGSSLIDTRGDFSFSFRSAQGLTHERWEVFEQCVHRHIVPFLCSVPDVLCFMPELSDKGRVFFYL